MLSSHPDKPRQGDGVSGLWTRLSWFRIHSVGGDRIPRGSTAMTRSDPIATLVDPCHLGARIPCTTAR
jgi:hypothetical protein